MILAALALSAGMQAGALSSSAGAGSPIVVEVANVRKSQGRVRIAVCAADMFLTNECAINADAPAVQGVTRVTVPHVAPGTYAVQVFHDLNDNGKVDRGAFGRPLEGVGFSNDARIGLSGPKWSKAAFRHGEAATTLSISLKHYTASDPEGPR